MPLPQDGGGEALRRRQRDHLALDRRDGDVLQETAPRPGGQQIDVGPVMAIGRAHRRHRAVAFVQRHRRLVGQDSPARLQHRRRQRLAQGAAVDMGLLRRPQRAGNRGERRHPRRHLRRADHRAARTQGFEFGGIGGQDQRAVAAITDGAAGGGFQLRGEARPQAIGLQRQGALGIGSVFQFRRHRQHPGGGPGRAMAGLGAVQQRHPPAGL